MIVATHTFSKPSSLEWKFSYENLPVDYLSVVNMLKSYVKENATEIIEYPDENTCKVTVFWADTAYDNFITVANGIVDPLFNISYLQWVENFKQIQSGLGYTFTRTIENVPD